MNLAGGLSVAETKGKAPARIAVSATAVAAALVLRRRPR